MERALATGLVASVGRQRLLADDAESAVVDARRLAVDGLAEEAQLRAQLRVLADVAESLTIALRTHAYLAECVVALTAPRDPSPG